MAILIDNLDLENEGVCVVCGEDTGGRANICEDCAPVKITAVIEEGGEDG